jgi:endogenous inhibitor of DNA gyrase (YacG/DUF329 family)
MTVQAFHKKKRVQLNHSIILLVNTMIFIIKQGMIIKFTEEEYNNTRATHKLQCECEECHKDFYIEKRHIARARTNDPKYKNSGRFCSNNCKNKHRKIVVELICHQCGKSFYKEPHKIQKNNHNFCSGNCWKEYKISRRVSITCPICGNSILRKKSEVTRNNKHYCSQQCYDIDKFKQINTTCTTCGKILQRKPCRIKTGLQFCSLKCFHQHLRKDEINLVCYFCGKPITKRECDLKGKAHSFCSISCSAKYNAAHKTWGCGRSKLEKWLEPQLKDFYPELEIHFNRNDTINSELDIYIPSMKLAFELNGIFHYEPIYGQELLDKIQNNDQRKFQACLERGIELCTIDNNSMRTFNENKALIFLGVITDIIDLKLDIKPEASEVIGV